MPQNASFLNGGWAGFSDSLVSRRCLGTTTGFFLNAEKTYFFF